MKIKCILKDQKIILDPHGHYEMASFDDSRYDFHMHKETKREIDGKQRLVFIKIPLNSDRKVLIASSKSNGKQSSVIPKKLEKEIRDALDDKQTREPFLKSIIEALKDYPKDFQNEENIRICFKRIGSAFGFDWDNLDIRYFISGIRKEKHIADITDTNSEVYRITLDKDKVVIEDMMMKSK